MAIGQTAIQITAGVNIGPLFVGKTTMQEVDSIENKNNLKTGHSYSGGSVSYSTKQTSNGEFVVTSTNKTPGIGVVYCHIKDTKLSAEQERNNYLKTKISSACIYPPCVAIDQNGNKLLGKTESEILKIYSKNTFETFYDIGKNKSLVDVSAGICFSFDSHTKKCIEIEIFQKKGLCFIQEYAQKLMMAH